MENSLETTKPLRNEIITVSYHYMKAQQCIAMTISASARVYGPWRKGIAQ